MERKANGNFLEELADSMERSDAIEALLLSKIVTALITARAERGMNQKEFAKFMGVSQAMVSKWEAMDCNFTIQTIAKICGKLNLVPKLDLLTETDYIAIKNQNNDSWDKGNNTRKAESNTTCDWYIIRNAA